MTGYRALVIRASAGTGKTFSLTNHLISLLAKGVSPDEILATTFTKKAAGEILERLFSRISDAALDSSKADELRGFAQLEQFAQGDAEKLLSSLIDQQHRLTICTLDSFFIRVARAYSLELGLPIAWRIIEEVAAREMLRAAIGEALSRTDIDALSDLMLLLNRGEIKHSVHAAIERDIGELLSVYREAPAHAWNWLSIAGAMDKSGLRDCILALEELDLPLTKKGDPNKVWLAANEEAVSRAREGEWDAFLDAGVAKKIVAGETMFSRAEISEEILAAYQPLIAHASSELLRRLQGQTLATHSLLSFVSERFDSLKLGSAGLRFDDVKYLLSENSLTDSGSDIYFRLDSRIKHLLLDEFQDTSRSEWSVIRPIVEEILSKAAEDNSFFCVGDVKQAIYGWRGGVSEIFGEFESGNWEIDRARLDLSYRSAPEIMDTVNSVFANISDNPVFESKQEQIASWVEDFQRHDTALKELSGHVSLRVLPAVGEEGEQENAAAIAETVKGLVELQPKASVAVLVRRNKMIPRIMMELKRQGIEASEEGGNPVHDSPFVAIIMSALELADYPENTIAAFHVSSSALGEAFGFEDATNDEKRRRLSLDLRRELSASGYGRTIFRWSSVLAPHCGKRDRMRLEQLVDLAFRFERESNSRPGYFADYVRVTRVALPSGSPVRVMTIHQSKGLEFDSVVLSDIDTVLGSGVRRLGVLQHRPDPLSEPDKVIRYPRKGVRALEPVLGEMYEQAVAEELRESLSVLYVALTRAVHTLTVLVPVQKNRSGPTFADILINALALDVERKAGAVLFEAGDRDWVRSWREQDSEVLEEVDAYPLEFADMTKSTRLQRRRATNDKGAAEDVFSYIENREARRRGTAFHDMLEGIEWLDDSSPSVLDLSGRVSRGHKGERRRFAEDLLSKLEMPGARDLLSRERYAKWGAERLEVFNELPYSVLTDGELLTGRIDRVVVAYNGSAVTNVEVIDYKTGDRREADRERYGRQLNSYKEVVSRMFNCPKELVGAGLLYVDSATFEAL